MGDIMKTKNIFLLGASLLPLASCAPPLAKPQTSVAVSEYLPHQKPVSGVVKANWWQIFNNPALNALEVDGLRANYDIAQAQDNLLAAQATGRAANGAYLPQLSINPNATRQTQSSGPTSSPPYTIYQIQGQLSYDPGLFGARHYTYQNSAAQVAYQAAELGAARQTVAGNIAQAAIALAGDEAEIKTTEGIIAADQNLLNLLQGEYADGAIAQLDVLRQQSTILAEQATLPPLQTAAQQQRDRLAVLTGKLPSDFTQANLKLSGFNLPGDVPAVLPSTYLKNRPDIQAALAQVAAQNAALGIAVAHLYPDLTLSADGGYAAETFNTMFNTTSAIWTLAGNLLAPIYNGGTLHAHKRAAQAQLAQALAAYHGAVLGAFSQAADALTAVQNSRVALQRAHEAAQTATQAYKLSAEQYALGAVDYTTVLTAQTAASQAQLSEAQAQTQLLADISTLESAMAPVAKL